MVEYLVTYITKIIIIPFGNSLFNWNWKIFTESTVNKGKS